MLGKQVHYKGGQPLLEGLPQTWAFLQVHSAGHSLAALEPTSHRSLHRGNLCRISALCWSVCSLGSGCCIFHNFYFTRGCVLDSPSSLLPSFVSKIIKWKWVGTQWTVETYKWSYVHGGLTLKPSPMNPWTGWDLAVCRVLKLGTIYPPISSQGLPSKGGFQQHMLKQEVELGGEQARLVCKALLLYDLWRQLCTITGAQLLINPNFPNYLALKFLIFHCCRFVPLTHAWKQGGEKLSSWDWKKNIWKSKGQGRVVRREDMRGKGEGKHSSRWWETAGSALPWSLA